MVLGFAGTAQADAVVVGRVTDLLSRPVPNVRVHVLTKTDHQIVKTDKDGNYQVVVDGNEDVSIVVGAGNEHTYRKGTVKDGTTNRLDFEVEIAEGEIIHIIDSKPFTVPPRLPEDVQRKVPPYSEEAVTRDAWAKAWLLLDIDEHGKVLRVKLVKRPGFELDEIAVKEAMKLHFTPALDERGKPMRTQIFWAMEWPSHGWMIEHYGTALRMPSESYSINPFAVDFGAVNNALEPVASNAPDTLTRKTFAHVRCIGDGPLNLDERYPTYRDCSKPNVKKVPFLQWIDGTQPIPPDPPQFAKKPLPPLKLTPASYIPQIAASAGTATLLATWIYTFVKYQDATSKFSRYTSATSDPHDLLDGDAEVRARERFFKWQKITVLTGLITVAAGGFTTSLWLRHQRAALSVQPEDDGATVSLSGRF